MMRLEGIGELIDRTTHWEFVYERCGHSQEFAQLGLEGSQRALREVQRYYAECLTCRLEMYEPQPVLIDHNQPGASSGPEQLAIPKRSPDDAGWAVHDVVHRRVSVNPRCSVCKSGTMFHSAHPFGPCQVVLPGHGACGCTVPSVQDISPRSD